VGENGIVITVVIVGIIAVLLFGRALFRLIRLIRKSAAGKSRDQLEIDRKAFSQATDEDER
jgi:hypothetical protein